MNGRLISRAAAVLCAAAAVISLMGLRTADTDKLDGAAFRPQPRTAAAELTDNAGSGEASGSGDGDQSTDSENDNSSGEDTEISAPAPGLSQPSEDKTSSDGGESHEKNDKDGRRVTPDSPASPDSELPGTDPEDGDETDEQLFTTSIRDGEHVTKAEYAFTITHLHKDYKLKMLTVRLNGNTVPWSGIVVLSCGRNSVRIYASYTDKDGKVHSGYKEYTVWLDTQDSIPDSRPDRPESRPDDDSSQPESRPDDSHPEQTEEPRLITDLSNMSTSAGNISFTAYIEGGDSSELKVYIGGRRLTDEGGGRYSCELSPGLNTVKLKGSAVWNGEEYSFGENYRITRTAETTPETAPELAYHNVPEQVRGDTYTLDLVARDYRGERIYDNGITVLLNGSEIKSSWIGEYTSYLLRLAGGENTLDIRVTDSEGRVADYSFVIVCSTAADGEVIGVGRMQLDANVLGLGALMPESDIEIRQGESAVQAIVRTLEQNGFSVELKGDYLVRISKPDMAEGACIPEELAAEIEADNDVSLNGRYSPDSLGERDFTTVSGWMIAVNGHYISYGAGDLHLKDGDLLQLRFTVALGKDIGDTSSGDCYEITY